MEPTNSELILSIVKQIAADVDQIKRQLNKKVPAQEILDPSTYVLYVHNEVLDPLLYAQALLHILPTSKMSGERKTLTESSILFGDQLECNLIALGGGLNPVELQRPDHLLIRSDDANLVMLCNGGSMMLSDQAKKKYNFLMEDLQRLSLRGTAGMSFKFELVDPETDPHWNDIQTLIYTARKEHAQDMERSNASSIGDNQDNGRPSGETV